MAMLKDTVVSGSLRATDSLLTTTLQTQIIKVPHTAGGTDYGTGTNKYVLLSNGSSAYWGTETAITKLGTISAGTWQGTAIGTAYGGTGNTSFTQWGIIYANPATKLVSTAAGTSGYLLQGNGSAAPSWIQATNANTANTIVKRDASGNFSAGAITASTLTVSGNQLYVGATDATAETDITLYGKDGSFSLFSHAGDGGHGLWAHPHGTNTDGKSVFYLDTNNNVAYAGGSFWGPMTGHSSTGTTTSDATGAVLLCPSPTSYTGIFNGNGDGTGQGTANLIIKSWYGVGFVDGCTGKGMTAGINCRTGDIYANGSLYIGKPTTSGTGIYWNSYVESATDGSDASAIYQIKSGVAGGTELRISQANDAADVINLVSPTYIYLNSKCAFTINDSWLRINESNGFSSGVYFGAGTGGVVRTDNQFQVGLNGSAFYANSSGDGKFSRDLIVGRYLTVTSTGCSWLVGQSHTRAIRMSDSTDTGSYWPWIAQTNTGSAKWFSLGVLNNSFYIVGSTTSRTENGYDYGWRFDVSDGYLYGNFSGSLSGNAATATALTSNAGSTEQPIYFTDGKPSATSYALKATVNNSTANYMAYYDGARSLTGTSYIRLTPQGTLSVFPAGGDYRDGIRIHARTIDNGWAAVVLCGSDNTGDIGTSASTWFIGASGGNLYFGKNGTGSSGTYLRCVNDTWAWNGTATGSISGSSASCTGNAATASAVAWTGVTGKPTQWDASTAATLSGGLPTPRSTGHAYLCGNGLFISGPATSNDCGWIRATQTSESDFVLEIATGDDGGNGETIVCRQYNTSNAVAHAITLMDNSGYSTFIRAYNAVWNDYAECRQVETEEPGYCVTESSSGIMIKTYKRLQAGCKITSDTFGTCMGETDTAKTPIAVAGRVLVYPYRARNEYPLGAAVCSAPNGTVDIMSRDEIMKYPERIVGTVSEIPTYEIWHGGEKDNSQPIEVKGRIWIYVR